VEVLATAGNPVEKPGEAAHADELIRDGDLNSNERSQECIDSQLASPQLVMRPTGRVEPTPFPA
jgi:hypothetical protein